MSIESINVAPNFATRRSIVAEDLRRLQEPAVIFEGQRRDEDGELMFMYTVAGWLDGQNIATIQGGCTVGGDVIVIHAANRTDADLMAGMGLQDTIDALNGEESQLQEAYAAQARLAALRPLERMSIASRPDAEKNPEFEADAAKIRVLAGDDVVLAAGRVEH